MKIYENYVEKKIPTLKEVENGDLFGIQENNGTIELYMKTSLLCNNPMTKRSMAKIVSIRDGKISNWNLDTPVVLVSGIAVNYFK